MNRDELHPEHYAIALIYALAVGAAVWRVLS
jgi:hypothetical protein